MVGPDQPAKRKRIRVIESSEDSSTSDSDLDSDPADDDISNGTGSKPSPFKIPKIEKARWTDTELSQLKKHFSSLAHLDDAIVKKLTFKEMAANEGRKDRNRKALTEKLAANYENVRSFPVQVEAGVDQCTGQAHAARFLRGYVGNSQELWLQGRAAWGINGIDPLSHYETVSVGLNGLVSCKVWHEVHSPSSKALSIRLLTPEALRDAWNAGEKAAEQKEFTVLHDLVMAVVALDHVILKVMPWNHSFATVAIFLQSVQFGERDLQGRSDRLAFLADFIDEVLRFNAQAWDEVRAFMSAQEVAAKWAASFLRRFTATPGTGTAVDRKKPGGGDRKDSQAQKRDRFPPGVCKKFNDKGCEHNGDKHAAHWDSDYILRHVCAKYLPEKRRFCFGNHPMTNHR